MSFFLSFGILFIIKILSGKTLPQKKQIVLGMWASSALVVLYCRYHAQVFKDPKLRKGLIVLDKTKIKNDVERIKELVPLLNEARKAYYQENREIMPNIEYDALCDELSELEEKTGMVLANSPTINIGYEVLSELVKVRHDTPILSLDKTKEISNLEEFLGTNTGLLSWKLDGLTIVLKYENGELIQAITRGNGEIGEDITHNAKCFKNIPLRINMNSVLIIRGEAVISYSDFEKINELLDVDSKYKNPRNLTSGTVRQLNSEIAAKRSVSFYAFTCVRADNMDFGDSKAAAMEWLESIGFDVVEHKEVNSQNIRVAVLEFADKIKNNNIASDGLVLTYDSISYSESVGSTVKFPRDSMAFKWADEIAETALLEIKWNTSRTGLINPVAVFEPVELEGTTVNKASVHNVSVLEGLQLGIGDKIRVYKANMIIPQIAENLTKSATAKIPEECLVCGSQTEVVQSKEGKFLYCTNPNCKAQLIRFLTHFSSRDAMNIDGFSAQTIEKFVDKGYLNNYMDIYSLEMFADEIKELEGFGEKSYNNLITSIERSKNINLHNFIYALGINQVGLAGAKLLCKNFSFNLDKIISADIEELTSVEGFGEVTADFIYKYFHNDENINLLNKAVHIMNFIVPEINQGDKTLDGLTFVVTGDVHVFKNRKELTQKIESLGGKITASVTGKTSYLINNDINSNSSKNKKAIQLSIPIITEEEFIAQFLV